MQTFRVEDMTCGHCASTITKAVRAVDASAKVEVDLGQHLVRIEPTEANGQELSDAIAEAGYTPVAVPAAELKKAGGCCGCCR
jgi:copper chaperone